MSAADTHSTRDPMVDNPKVAVITGAARGIGRATAFALARQGMAVVLSDLVTPMDSLVYATSDQSTLTATVSDLREAGHDAHGVAADVRSQSDLERVIDQTISRYGRLDCVVANAGIASFGPTTWELTRQQWDDMIGVTLTGTWNTCRAAIPAMLDAGNGGSIVIVSSTAGLKPLPTVGHYSAAKAGLVGLMRSLALEAAPHWIRVNTVHPGGTATYMTENDKSEEWQVSLGDANEALELPLPIGRMEPEAIADAITWLSSSEARYITGTTMVVDGGALLK